MFRTAVRVSVAALLALVVAAASAHSFESDGVTVAHPWARATPPGAPAAAAYFEISTASEDRLIGVSSPIARRAQLHRTINEDGQSRMEHVEAVPVGPDEPVRFAPGGYHVMLMGLEHALREGQHFPLRLELDNAGIVEVEVVVESMTTTEGHGGGGHHAGRRD